MIAAAYRYAENGGNPPREVTLLSLIKEFGAQMILRRDYLGAGEILRVKAAEKTILWYREREESDDWATWASDHVVESEFLVRAMKAAYNE